MFVNTLNADGKYPVQYCDNLRFRNQKQLCKKQKIFSEFFVWFLEPTSNFKHFAEKDDGRSYYISELIDCENLSYTTLWKASFQKTLWQSTCENVRNTCKKSMRSLFSCFSSFWGKLIWKISPLVLGKV